MSDEPTIDVTFTVRQAVGLVNLLDREGITFKADEAMRSIVMALCSQGFCQWCGGPNH